MDLAPTFAALPPPSAVAASSAQGDVLAAVSPVVGPRLRRGLPATEAPSQVSGAAAAALGCGFAGAALAARAHARRARRGGALQPRRHDVHPAENVVGEKDACAVGRVANMERRRNFELLLPALCARGCMERPACSASRGRGLLCGASRALLAGAARGVARRVQSCTAVDTPLALLSQWRASRRSQITPAVAMSWARTDSWPRGKDADFVFQHVNLVGGRPTVWIYFVDSVNNWARTCLARLLFQKVCDNTFSYTVLLCSAGCLPAQPGEANKEQAVSWSTSSDAGLLVSDLETMISYSPDRFEGERVFKSYDVIVAVDETARQEVIAAAGDDEEAARSVCTLADFIDFCGEWPAGVGGQASGMSLDELKLHTDLPAAAGGAAAVALDALALSAAGLERFLVAQFPASRKEELHPDLIPKGI
mmetsp:Transcript_61811/g.201673  ORF Transcript_61811/g.201673 Transcript_61811/m.201673 type:complete len:422 (-) Transcript_61811:111-1376(-)